MSRHLLSPFVSAPVFARGEGSGQGRGGERNRGIAATNARGGRGEQGDEEFIFRGFGIRLIASVCLVVTGRGGSPKFTHVHTATACAHARAAGEPLLLEADLTLLLYIQAKNRPLLSDVLNRRVKRFGAAEIYFIYRENLFIHESLSYVYRAKPPPPPLLLSEREREDVDVPSRASATQGQTGRDRDG